MPWLATADSVWALLLAMDIQASIWGIVVIPGWATVIQDMAIEDIPDIQVTLDIEEDIPDIRVIPDIILKEEDTIATGLILWVLLVLVIIEDILVEDIQVIMDILPMEGAAIAIYLILWVLLVGTKANSRS